MLEPVTFKYNCSQSDRLHIGFIAQDIETAIENAALTTREFGGFVRMESERSNTEGYELGLRYEEFIALNTHMIKQCMARIASLEAEMEVLRNGE